MLVLSKNVISSIGHEWISMGRPTKFFYVFWWLQFSLAGRLFLFLVVVVLSRRILKHSSLFHLGGKWNDPLSLFFSSKIHWEVRGTHLCSVSLSPVIGRNWRWPCSNKQDMKRKKRNGCRVSLFIQGHNYFLPQMQNVLETQCKLWARSNRYVRRCLFVPHLSVLHRH